MNDNKKVIDERRRKAKIIIDPYERRKDTQKGIAKKLNMSVANVAKVTKANNYRNTIHKEPENVKPGQKLNMAVDYKTFGFLDKYNF